MEKGKYLEAGQIISLALIHGGPAPEFLSHTLFSCIAFGIDSVAPSMEDIGNTDIFSKLSAVAESKSLDELQKAIANCDMLMEIGVSPVVTDFELKNVILTGRKSSIHSYFCAN